MIGARVSAVDDSVKCTRIGPTDSNTDFAIAGLAQRCQAGPPRKRKSCWDSDSSSVDSNSVCNLLGDCGVQQTADLKVQIDKNRRISDTDLIANSRPLDIIAADRAELTASKKRLKLADIHSELPLSNTGRTTILAPFVSKTHSSISEDFEDSEAASSDDLDSTVGVEVISTDFDR